MFDRKLIPMMGMNNAREYSALEIKGDAEALFVRDAVNIDFDAKGKVYSRAGVEKVTDLDLEKLWQDEVTGDVFGLKDGSVFRLNMQDWTSEFMFYIGVGKMDITYINNVMVVSGRSGLFEYNGIEFDKMTIENCPPPFVSVVSGTMQAGDYGVAASFVYNGKESSLSQVQSVTVGEGGGLEIVLPISLQGNELDVRVYITQCNGSELYRLGTYKAEQVSIRVHRNEYLGASPTFMNKSPMISGEIARHWGGRLFTSINDTMYFSEPLAYHITDERFNFIKLPTRITFIEPVEGGIWVGQENGVLFISGADPKDFTLVKKSAKKPIPYSSIIVKSSEISGDFSQGSSPVAIWLSENGYVAGTSEGLCYELHKGVIEGIKGNYSATVVFGRRLTTIVS